MKSVDELIEEKIIDRDRQIYHYTSLEGLKSILETNTLRFTECCYMNDKEEYNDILRIMDNLISDYTSIKDRKTTLLTTTRNNIDDKYGNDTVFDFTREGKIDITGSRYFILSTTIKKDSLPMWHYYSKGKTNNGCVISFNTAKLKKKIDGIKDTRLYCGRVIYDDNEKKSIINEATDIIVSDIEYELEQFKDYPDDIQCQEYDRIMDEAVGTLMKFIEKIRLFFKSSSFDYEKEYRLLLVVRDNIYDFKKNIAEKESNISINFSIYEGIIRMHVDLNFDKLALSGIMFSPTADLSTCKRGVTDLLNYFEYPSSEKSVCIEKSKCSIRF